MSTPVKSPPPTWWTMALLLLPFLALIPVPIYNRVTPAVFGVPFFYWYQLLWIALSAVAVGIAYWAEQSRSAR